MHEIALTLGSLTIRWYGVMVALGFLAAMMIMQTKRKYAGMNVGEVSDYMFMIIVSGVLGARIFYVIEFWDQFKNNLWEIFRIDHGGLVFYGGFICTIICIFVYCIKKNLSISRVMDASVPGLALGHALGRIGCFLNGCCYGAPTTSCLGVVYPLGSFPDHKYQGLALHPVQLYESTGNIIIALILYFSIGRVKPGQTLSLYLILYGILRFVDEFFRGDNVDFFMGLFTPGQTVGLGVIPAGIFFFIYFQIKGKKNDAGNRV